MCQLSLSSGWCLVWKAIWSGQRDDECVSSTPRALVGCPSLPEGSHARMRLLTWASP